MDRRQVLRFSLAAPWARASRAAGLAAPPRGPEPVEIGSRLELFVDRTLVEDLRGTRLELHPPEPAETVLGVDRPWEGKENLGISILRDGPLYRMYYRGMASETVKGRCYAESRDGIHWTKPNLGLVPVAGTLDNNAIVEEGGKWTYFLIPFLDTRPGVPAAERLKAVSPKFSRIQGRERRELYLHVSADGVRWRKLRDEPVLVTDFPNAFDSLVCVFWSPAEGQYVLYSRYMVDAAGRPSRKEGRRTLARATSPDLRRWSGLTPMTFEGTGVIPADQLYTSQVEPYFRAPHIYVAFPMRFMEGRQVVPDGEATTLGLTEGRNRDCSDGVFMTSRAGSTHFDWIFREAFIRPGTERGNWGTRSNIALWGIVPAGPDEISIYVNRNYGTDACRIVRYRSRTDGFVSVRAPYAGGELRTKPLRFQGRELVINYSTSAAGGIRVELQDGAGHPLPGRRLADARAMIGDEIERVVAWQDGGDVGALAGRPVRLRFEMKDADLYSIRFR
jgi:hypothetical protein